VAKLVYGVRLLELFINYKYRKIAGSTPARSEIYFISFYNDIKLEYLFPQIRQSLIQSKGGAKTKAFLRSYETICYNFDQQIRSKLYCMIIIRDNFGSRCRGIGKGGIIENI
jgi:hypothetical protein